LDRRDNASDESDSEPRSATPRSMPPTNGAIGPKLLSKASTAEAAELYGWKRTNGRGYTIKEEPLGTEKPIRIVVMGAGAAGINFCKLAEDRLSNAAYVCYEKNDDVGGTWLENV
jgi:hypothetical protein